MALRDQVIPAKPKRSRKPKDTPGIGHNATPNWKGYAEELDALDSELEALQEQKRTIYKDLREVQGRAVADALKNAMRIRRMKAEKREHADKVDALTFEILNSIDEGLDSKAEAEHARAPAPRKALPPHDPTTGEITEVRDGIDRTVAGAAPPAEPAADKGSALNSKIGTAEAPAEAPAASNSVAGHGADESPAPTHPKGADIGKAAFLIREQPGRGA